LDSTCIKQTSSKFPSARQGPDQEICSTKRPPNLLFDFGDFVKPDTAVKDSSPLLKKKDGHCLVSALKKAINLLDLEIPGGDFVTKLD
jgi:hypothetical protein